MVCMSMFGGVCGPMTLKHIKIFIAVCDTGSMTAAAKELFIAQPAVSFAIAELEHYYGQKLFERISNRLYITEAGKALLARGKQIVSMFDSMETEIRGWGDSDTLRIGGSVSIGGHILPKLIRSLQIQYPDIRIQVRLQNSPAIEQMILDGVLDVGLIEGPILSKMITGQKVGENDLVFICPKDHAWADAVIDISQLNNQNFAVREKGSMERRLLDKVLQTNKIRVNLVWQSVNPESVISAVANGFGISAVSKFAADGFLRRGDIRTFQIKGLSFHRDVFVIHPPNKVLTHAIQDFMELCGKELSVRENGI